MVFFFLELSGYGNQLIQRIHKSLTIKLSIYKKVGILYEYFFYNYFLMHDHKIYAMVGGGLFNKFKLSLKEEAVYTGYRLYIIYNFRVSINEI